MTITNIEDLSDLAKIVAGLVREGVTFECKPHKDVRGWWTITLLGGF